MSKDILLILRYLVAGEESRIGRTDYWNSVFLAAQTPFNRIFLGFLKVSFILTLCTSLMALLDQL